MSCKNLKSVLITQLLRLLKAEASEKMYRKLNVESCISYEKLHALLFTSLIALFMNE